MRLNESSHTNRSSRLFKLFESMFPDMANGVTHYGPVDFVTIKMETTAHVTLIFTYVDVKNWSLQTFTSYKETSQNKR